jgi:hypothetical protein
MTSTYHHSWLAYWDGSLNNFLSRLALNQDPPSPLSEYLGLQACAMHGAQPDYIIFSCTYLIS